MVKKRHLRLIKLQLCYLTRTRGAMSIVFVKDISFLVLLPSFPLPSFFLSSVALLHGSSSICLPYDLLSPPICLPLLPFLFSHPPPRLLSSILICCFYFAFRYLLLNVFASYSFFLAIMFSFFFPSSALHLFFSVRSFVNFVRDFQDVTQGITVTSGSGNGHTTHLLCLPSH